jgi:RNA polymerase sigma factor (sigma-70 family)
VSTLTPALPSTDPAAARARAASFAPTRWSLVLLAGRHDTERARAALGKLCATYWYPLYVYARRRGCGPPDAQDLTQAFFARLLERQSLAAADPARGRFRSFILTAMKNFLADEWEKSRSLRRGGGATTLSLDWAAAEHHYHLEPVDGDSPDKAFDRRWALALLDAALAAVEEEYRQDDAAELFAALRGTLVGERAAQPYAELGARLGLSESAIKVAVHRLRKRYRARLRAEIAQTVATVEEVDEELRHLFRSLAGP